MTEQKFRVLASLRTVPRRADAWQQQHPVVAFPVAVIRKFGDDRGGSLAALVAYYGFFSIFPLLMVLDVVTARALRGDSELRRRVIDSAVAEFPVIGDQIRSNIGTIRGSTFVLVFGFVGAIWAGMAVLTAIQSAMDEVWDVPRRERSAWLPRLFRGLIALIALGLTVLVATATASAAAALGSWRAAAVGLAISTTLNVLTMAVIFRSSTSARVSWNDVLPGAAIAGLVWTLLQAIGAYIVDRHIRGASNAYGTFAVVIGLLTWLYLGAQLTVIAAEINVVRCRRLWPRSLVSPPTRPEDEEALTLQARQEEALPSERVVVRFGGSVERKPTDQSL
ncbi:MAG: YihY/virulence factor BrkB family protein [Actinomycetota bacterium]